MIIVACLDDKGGMMFNHRRQSQDRVLRTHLLELAAGHSIWMSQYSAGQFDAAQTQNINVDDAFLEKAGHSDYCFIESSVQGVEVADVERVILFKWNRIYPADAYFDFSLAGWTLTASQEFEGSSHDKITMEVYEK